MIPILKYASDNKTHTITETIDSISKVVGVSEEAKNTLMPSGRRTYMYDRVAWAVTYLSQAGLLERTGRGEFKISDLGLTELPSMPGEIGWDFLNKYEPFRKFKTLRHRSGKTPEIIEPNNVPKGIDSFGGSPNEAITEILDLKNTDLAEEILTNLGKVSPSYFEKIIIDVMLALDYGKDVAEMAKVLGKPNDEGIDGEIPMDKLGFDKIFLQAKRWNSSKTVGPHDVRDFIGALVIKNAQKGVFITTSTFTKDAKATAEKDSDHKIVLIDGIELANLMIENNVGVREANKFTLKEIDRDYFETD